MQIVNIKGHCRCHAICSIYIFEIIKKNLTLFLPWRFDSEYS